MLFPEDDFIQNPKWNMVLYPFEKICVPYANESFRIRTLNSPCLCISLYILACNNMLATEIVSLTQIYVQVDMIGVQMFPNFVKSDNYNGHFLYVYDSCWDISISIKQHINRNCHCLIVLILMKLEVNICCHVKCFIVKKWTDMICLYNVVCL